MFSNRDYVFNRRYLIDQEKNIIVVINKGTEHPNVPENPQNHRVKDYWSFMVIKACTDIDEVSVGNFCLEACSAKKEYNGFNVNILHEYQRLIINIGVTHKSIVTVMQVED